MEVQPDFRDLLALFNKHQVEYIIVGGYALAFHGAPRYTGDIAIDIFIRPDPLNASRIMAALDEFGFASVGLTPADFEKQNTVVQLGVPPVRIDIITALTGVSWEEAFAKRATGQYGDLSVYYVGLEQFISNKKATGRKKIWLTWKLLEKNSHRPKPKPNQSFDRTPWNGVAFLR